MSPAYHSTETKHGAKNCSSSLEAMPPIITKPLNQPIHLPYHFDKEDSMHALAICNEKSLLANEPIDEQKAVESIALYLCRTFGIKPRGREFITKFGLVSNNSNAQALSPWVFMLSKQLEFNSQEELITLLSNKLERQLTA